MTTKTRERLEMVRDDCEKDAARPIVETVFVDAATLRFALSSRLGEVYAMIQALANSMLEQEARLDAMEATLERAEAAVTEVLMAAAGAHP